MELDPGAEVEVAKLDRGEPVPVHAQHVLGLEISMRDPLGVEKLESIGHVTDDVGRLLLSEELPDDTKKIGIIYLVLCRSSDVVTLFGYDPAVGPQKPSRILNRTCPILRNTR